MSMDVKRPKKRFRKAWNGGKPPAITPEMHAYVKHADNCETCLTSPCRTCAEGLKLFNQATALQPPGESQT